MTKENNQQNSLKYPSAELLAKYCHDDYIRLLHTYDNIYSKINIILVFYGAVIFAIINKLDFNMLINLHAADDNGKFFLAIIIVALLIFSIIMGIIAIINLLILIKTKAIFVVDTIAIRNDKVYEWSADEAGLWLIDKYTIAINSLRVVVNKKQIKLDQIITKILISIGAYIVALIMEKGL